MEKLEDKISTELALQMRQVGNLKILCEENEKRDRDEVERRIQVEVKNKVGTLGRLITGADKINEVRAKEQEKYALTLTKITQHYAMIRQTLERTNIIDTEQVYGQINQEIEALQTRLDQSFFDQDEQSHSKIVSMAENAKEGEDDEDAPQKSWTMYKITLQIDSINFKLTNEFDQLLLTWSMDQFQALFT